MRKSVIVFCAVLYACCFFVSCESVKQSYSALEACRNDAVCYAEMEKGRDLVSSIAASTAASIPQTAPVAPVIGSGLGMLASLVIGIYLGKKKEK